MQKLFGAVKMFLVGVSHTMYAIYQNSQNFNALDLCTLLYANYSQLKES